MFHDMPANIRLHGRPDEILKGDANLRMRGPITLPSRMNDRP